MGTSIIENKVALGGGQAVSVMESKRENDWSSLPDDILRELTNRLLVFMEQLSFRCVCANWRSFLKLRDPIQIYDPQIPQLMFPSDFGFQKDDPLHVSGNKSDFRDFLSFQSDGSCAKIRRLSVPEAAGKFCCGSSQGWLVLLNHPDPSVSLLNPITGSEIQLPLLTTLPTIGLQRCMNDVPSKIGKGHHKRFFEFKVVVAPNPTPNSYIAMAIFGDILIDKNLAFCKSGGPNEWIRIEGITPSEIIYHEGQFYAIQIEKDNQMYVISNLDGPNPSPSAVPVKKHQYSSKFCHFKERRILKDCCDHHRYLVELPGDLLIVIRVPQILGYKKISMGRYVECLKTEKFYIFKYEDQISRWVMTRDIGSYTLFVGAHSCIAVNSPKCRANCICFTNDYLTYCNPIKLDDEGKNIQFKSRHASVDCGIFDLKKNVVEQFPIPYGVQSFLVGAPPIWFTPSLY